MFIASAPDEFFFAELINWHLSLIICGHASLSFAARQGK